MKQMFIRMLGILLAVSLIFGLNMSAYASELVYTVPIQGDIEPGLATFVARGLALAERNHGTVLLEINTFGGRVDAATEIKDLLVKAQIPVLAFVSERAWSAGALITLAAGKIAMAPGASLGAAEPRPMEEKTVSALKAEFEATAEQGGRNRLLAAAMVDADVVVEGLVEKGKILTLSAQEALEWGMADLVAENRHDVLREFGYEDYQLVTLKPHWAERIARFLTGPTVSSFLLSLGFLGLIVEIVTPGWGVPGTGGLVALVLFFGGRYVAGLAGFEEIGLFILGILLLLIEGFVIPGFGIVGILGIGAVLGSIILVFGDLQLALLSISIALTVSIVAVAFLWKRIRATSFWRRVVLHQTESREEGYAAPPDFSFLQGRQGLTLTPLRPAGTILIDDNRYDVVSEGNFIPAESLVEVVSLEGTRIVVREVVQK